MHPIHRLRELGQSVWLDFIDRRLLSSGELERLIAEDGIAGLTSNPTIFQKSIASSNVYDALIQRSRPVESDVAVFEQVEISDITLACDSLLPLYEQSGGADGFVSIEVSPAVATNAFDSIAEARRLWAAAAHPNLMVKIPGTKASLPAIEVCLAEGININITLLFSVVRYLEVAEAYLRALETRADRGQSLGSVASVASFFVSRVDTKVDGRIDRLSGSRHECAASLRGQTGIANAKMAYEAYQRIVASARWQKLEQQGAKRQRLLWASTSPKDEAYSDTYYVDALVGADTVDTMARDTLRAYLDHGQPAVRLNQNTEHARAVLDGLGAVGIDFSEVAFELEQEGVRSFAKSFDAALATIAEKRRVLRSA